MNAELKEKWVKALRSGRYKQTRGRLTRGRKEFCCLGVVCEVLGIEPDLRRGRGYFYAGDHQMLSPSVTHRLDLLHSPELHKLASMNDNGKSFSEIADYIEANL